MAGQGWQRSSADAPHHPYVAQGREGLADHWWNVNAGTRALAELTRVCFINPFQGGRCGPQGLKPAFFLALNGTAEAVPFPKPARTGVFRQSETGQAPSLHEFFRKL